nr:hypothetical protein B0A51_07353 [Rachicladosporium sp. CCFEE 5018]
MSFGGFGGANSGSTFGGFGNNANNTATTSAGGSLFGGGTATTGGFGGFGGSNNSTSSPFGAAKPAGFGAPAATTAGGSMFGGGTSTAGGFGGGGGFGATNNTGGGLFGASKPAATGFGANATSGGLFGSSTGGGFGGSTQQNNNPFGGSTGAASNPFGGAAAPAASTGFGSTAGNSGSGFAFGGGNAGAAASTTQGTPAAPYTATTEKEAGTSNTTNAYQSLTFQQPFQNKSFEELRVEDYVQNKRYPQGNSFGSGSTFGGFGGGNAAQPAQTGGGLFGNSGSTSTGFGGGNAGTGFGGGATSGGLFGQNKPATTSLFGGANTSSAAPSTGFGATATGGGGLFGNSAQQPATGGGLFGGSGSTGGFGANASGGGLFGQANQAQPAKPAFGGFGASNNTTASTGFRGGFGATQQPAAQQPAQSGGLFGNSTSGGFGANNTSGGLFGGTNQAKPATGGLFGNSTTTNNTGGGLFGGSGAQSNTFGQSQPAAGGLFGSAPQNNTTGGGLFGNNAAKPATGGLFGNSTSGTGGSLFGNNQQQNTGASTSLFGGGQQAQQTGGLFGNSQAKPATGGLFGASNNGTQAGGLFGGAQQNNNAGGNSLFGNSQGQGNSLFGNSQGQNQAGNSLFGNSQQQQPQQNQLTATLTGDPYGNAQLFSSLAAPSPPVGPLATPLSGARAPAKPRASLLSSIRSGSSMLGASQSMTPKARPGYGFSYSTYNSPSSGSFNLSPGASSLLRPAGSIGSALSGRLSKSLSTSNLRSEVGAGSGLLRTPMNGQSSLLLGGSLLGSGSGSLGSASMRRLKIDRNVRSDLFGPTPSAAPQATPNSTEEPTYPDLECQERDTQRGGPRKSVSFDNNGATDQSSSGNSGALVIRQDDDETTPTSTPAPVAPPASRQNSSRVLSSVVEEGSATKPAASKQSAGTKSKPDPKVKIPPGDYWTQPSMKTIRSMSRQQLSAVKDFKIGRANVGVILFNPGKTVDLSAVPLDDLLPDEEQGKMAIVRLIPRNATVYLEPFDNIKPPIGQGLNVPSTIHLEQSWPRSAKRSQGARPDAIAASRELSAHKMRLSKVGGTTLKDYDPDTGVWTFTVPHYTSYGLDSDDEDDDDEDMGELDLQVRIPTSMQSAPNTHTTASSTSRMDTSGLSEPPATAPSAERDDSEADSELAAQEEDTFEFKLAKRSQQSNAVAVPGGFDDGNSLLDTELSHADESVQGINDKSEPVTDRPIGGAVQPPSPNTLEKYHSSMLLDSDEDEVDAIDQDLPGSFLAAEPKAPKSILKTRTTAFASPDRVAEMTWEDQLLRTISPKKRDRQALRDMQAGFAAGNADDLAEESPFKKTLLDRSQFGQSYLATKSAKKSGDNLGNSTMSVDNKMGRSVGFATRMEMMDSLWGGAGEKSSRTRHPSALSRPLRPFNGNADENNEQWHESLKPHFTSTDVLTVAVTDIAVSKQQDLQPGLQPLVGETKDIQFLRVVAGPDLDAPALALQKQQTDLVQDAEQDADENMLLAEAPGEDFAFATLAELHATDTPLGMQEQAVWQLCSTLFDPIEVSAHGLIDGMSAEGITAYEPRLRLDALRQMWTQLISAEVNIKIAGTRSQETKALYLLVKGDVVAASQLLVEAGNSRLAILVSQLPSSAVGRDLLMVQIEAWQKRKDWTEFSDPIKALWTIVSGQTCSVSGVNAGGPEDRIKAFKISERFELNWRMAFALRMQFSGAQNIEDLVHGYVDDLEDGEERVGPSSPWGEDEDTLLGVLRLYAYPDAPVVDLIEPKAVSGNALHSRLSWQLGTLLHAKGFTIEDSDVDKMSVDFAAQLEAAGEWSKAAWVLMHLHETETRMHVVKELLERNAAQLPDHDEDEAMDENEERATWRIESLHLPKHLVENAKALHASAVLQDPARQISYLLSADTDEALTEAHDVLCDIVGPKAIISRSYTELRTLIKYFTNANAPARLEEWRTGGKLYADFSLLHDMEPRKRQGRDGRNVCYALGKALSAATGKAQDGKVEMPLVVRVALGEMEQKVRAVEKEEGFEGALKDKKVDAKRDVDTGKVEKMWEGYRLALSAA